VKARAKQPCESGARRRAAGRGRPKTLVVVASTTAILCAMAGAALAQEASKSGINAATEGSTAARSGYPSLRRIDFDGDFDAGCRLLGDTGGWQRNVITQGSGTGSIVRTVVAQGKCAARLTSTGSHGRAELGKKGGGPDPHVVYEGLYRVPSSTSHIGAFTQHKQGPPSSADCYNGGLSNRSNRIELVTVGRCTEPQSRGQRRFDLGVMPRNHWFAVKVELKFSNNPAVGYAKVWLDRDGPGPRGYVVALSRTGVDAESGNHSGARVKFRTGTYSSGSRNRTVYVDGWHMKCVTHC
jgi:polysaccharide lyase-like protein